MIKRIISAIRALPLFALLLAGCRDQDGSLEVTGKVANNPRRQIVYLDLIGMDGSAPRSLDTATLPPGTAAFTLKGAAGGKDELYRLRFEEGERFVLLVNDKGRISVDLDWKNPDAYGTNSGSSASLRDLLQGYGKRIMMLDSLSGEVERLEGEVESDSLLGVRQKEYQSTLEGTEAFLLGYADTAASAIVSLYAVGLGRDGIDAEKLKPVMLSLARRFSDRPQVTAVTTEFFRSMQQQQSSLAVGMQAPDFTLPDTEGRSLSLSSLRGKYVLVDFWASWCGPCRQENPNVVKSYQAFKDRNFTILGVSLDRDREAWLKAIRDDGLAWSHVSDLRFWESAVVPMYNIQGIPYNVLLDPQGRIVASNLRGPALSARLSEVLR